MAWQTSKGGLCDLRQGVTCAPEMSDTCNLLRPLPFHNGGACSRVSVARMCVNVIFLCDRNGRLPAVGQEAQPQAVPVPDVLEGILAKQNVLLMDSSNIVINRDGSLKAKGTPSTACQSL